MNDDEKCPKSKSDDGSHSEEWHDGDKCYWCGAEGLSEDEWMELTGSTDGRS